MMNNTSSADHESPFRYPDERNRRRRGHDFYAGLDSTPSLYETEHVPCEDKIIHAHYFVGGADWYIAELDPSTLDGFGYCRIQVGEWGYVNLTELERMRIRPGFVVERDIHWMPKPFRECVRDNTLG